ncbi:MAG: beta-propeller fold lactonase family protein [Acidobacteria bacterium]|nr:beta-propeller fold lactonase family protein [Acidobacteriota bacterium]
MSIIQICSWKIKCCFLSLFLNVALFGLSTPLWAQGGGFAYVANWGSDNVSAYIINATTGALTPVLGSPFPAGSAPGSVTVDPTGQFAYVANTYSHNVSAYTINPATGALTPVADPPFPAGAYPAKVTVDPTGQFAYVANEVSANVSAYTINGTTGALTPVAGPPVPAGTGPSSVTVDPTGQFVYVANRDSNNVSAYRINGTTGALTPVADSPFPAGTTPYSVTVDPTGQFAYVTNCGPACGINPGNVSAYRINGTTGALTAVADFPAGSQPISVTVDPTGQFVYVANSRSSTVSAYTIDGTTGALAPVPGSPFPGGLVPHSVTVDSTGQFAYVANCGGAPGNCNAPGPPGNILAYTINPDTGALTQIAGPPFPAGTRPVSVTTTAGRPTLIHPVEPWTKSGFGFGDDWVVGDCFTKPICDPLSPRRFKHVGFDAQAGPGDPVVAAAAGSVKLVIPNGGSPFAGVVVLEHDLSGGRVTTVYWHVDPLVSQGTPVGQGEISATVAEISGAHLHFGFRSAPFDSNSNWGALPPTGTTGCIPCFSNPVPLPAFRNNWEDPQLLLFKP